MSSCPRRALERATKWDKGYSEASDGVSFVYSHLRMLKDQRITTSSVLLDLQAKLVQARVRIHEFESESQLFKKKVKRFLKKLEEERVAWKRREHEKNRADIDELRNELGRERKSRQRLEVINMSLVNQLANAKLSTQQFKKEYEEEKKNRDLMEEVCNELAKQIGEDKTEVERLKRETMKVHEELEEERKMLQIAEVWREERVHMKLNDAKLALEDKYCEMNKLITDLETFIRSRCGTLDISELRKAELILRAVKSVTNQDVEEFTYVPPKSDDIFFLLKELGDCEEEMEIEPCASIGSRTYHDFKTQKASPYDNLLDKNPALTYLNCPSDDNSGFPNDTQGFDTVSRAEDQGSSYSLEEHNSSHKRVSEGNNVLRSKSECDEHADQNSPNIEISEVCSVSVNQSKLKASSVSKIWRSYPCNGLYKMIFAEGDRRLSTETISSVGTTSPHRGVDENERRRNGQWISSDLANPHITRGMKGCIEWPRAIHKSSLKAKNSSEARNDGQKLY